MRTGLSAWALTLSGLVVWAIHFGGLYAIVSWMDLNDANAAPGRWIAGAFSVGCVLALLVVAGFIRRDRRLSSDLGWFALAGALIAGLAILFQTAPLVLM